MYWVVLGAASLFHLKQYLTNDEGTTNPFRDITIHHRKEEFNFLNKLKNIVHARNARGSRMR